MQPYDGRGEDKWCSLCLKKFIRICGELCALSANSAQFFRRAPEKPTAPVVALAAAGASLLLRARAIGTARTGRPSSRGRCRDRDTSRGCRRADAPRCGTEQRMYDVTCCCARSCASRARCVCEVCEVFGISFLARFAHPDALEEVRAFLALSGHSQHCAYHRAHRDRRRTPITTRCCMCVCLCSEMDRA